MGYVYKITCIPTGKAYIGISIHEPEKKRIKDHLSGRGNRIIANAVNKYGKDAFTYEILEANVFDEFLPDLEVAYIANFNTVRPNGYNLTYGGEAAIPSEETRRKLSELNKGKKHSAETRRKMSESQTGRKHTPETRRKISEANKGKERSAEHRRKLSEANKGKKGKPISAEHRRKLSEAIKRKLTGRKLPPETRAKMSESRKGKKHSEETRAKMSKAHKGKTKSDEIRANMSKAQKGRVTSEETRRKISKAHKGRVSPNKGNVYTSETRRKLSEANKGRIPANRHVQYLPAHNFYLSLPNALSLDEKRKQLQNAFKENVPVPSINAWVRKWSKS